MTDFIVSKDGTIEDDVTDVKIVDSINPFGNYAEIKIDDFGGAKFEDYSRETRVDIDVDPPNQTQTTRFSGFSVEARENDRQGADVLQVEAYSFDQLLRRNSVTNDQSGGTLSDALQDIIETDTPVAYEPTNVEIIDDQEITRPLQQVPVENALQFLSFISGNEAFGVNDDLEFFFRPRENDQAPRDVSGGELVDHDIPRRGKEAVNEVTVFFDGGDESVTVSAGEDALNLQDSLGTVDAVRQTETITEELITDIEDARAIGEQVLELRNETLAGEITTIGLETARPGEVVGVEIPSRGIDTDFRIVSVELQAGSNLTTLGIVEKRGFQDDVLLRLSDSVKKVERRPNNPDAIDNRVTTTKMGALVDVESDTAPTYDASRLVNNGRNAIRDGWIDGSGIGIDTIAVGSDNSSLSRANTSLRNQTNSASATVSTSGNKEVVISGNLSQTDVQEVGLFAGSTLIARAVYDAPVDITDPDFRLTVSNDPQFNKGVLTDTGQEAVRDVIADNAPSTPTQYAYGTDGTEPTEADTSLGNQQVAQDVDEILVQEATIQSQFENVVSISDTDPVIFSGDSLAVAQSATFQTDRDASVTESDFENRVDDIEAINQLATSLLLEGQFLEWTFSTEYDINDVRAAFRLRTPDGEGPGLTYSVDGEQSGLVSDCFSSTDYTIVEDIDISGIQAGEHTFRITVDEECLDGNGDPQPVYIDYGAVVDDRFSYTFDNTTDANDQLSGPELYPDLYEFEFDSATTRREADGGRLEQTWDDTSNNQFVELASDSGFTDSVRADNSQTVSGTLNGTFELFTRVGFSRYTTDSSTTPTTGDTGQSISATDLFAFVDAIQPFDTGVSETNAVISRGTISGVQIREGGHLDSSGNALTRSVFPAIDFTITNADLIRLQSSERVGIRNA